MDTFVGAASAAESAAFIPACEHFERILAATDFSTASAPAIAQAIAMAKSNARLWIAHAYEPRSMFDGFLSTQDDEQRDQSLRNEFQKKLRPLVEMARRESIDAEPLILVGEPTEAIVAAARRLGADLIIMGTRGRQGVARLVLGSVAAQVISIAPCAVLTVRGKA